MGAHRAFRIGAAALLLVALGAGAREAAAVEWIDSTASLHLRVSPLRSGLSLLAAGDSPSARIGAWSVDLVSATAAAPRASDPAAYRVSGLLRARLDRGADRVWFAAGVEHRDHFDHTSATAVLEGGADGRRGPFVLKARVRERTLWVRQLAEVSAPVPPDTSQQQSPETFLAYETGPASVLSLDLATAWARDSWVIEAGAGVAAGKRFRPIWLVHAHALRWLRPGIGATLGAEYTGPSWFSDDLNGGARLQLGVRIEPRRVLGSVEPEGLPRALRSGRDGPRFELRHAEGRSYLLRVRMPGASQVSLRGSFTGWETRPMQPAANDWWELALELEPGMHQLEIQADDGPWRVPEGTTSLPGEYGENVGSFVAD